MQEEQFIINEEHNGMRIDLLSPNNWKMYPVLIFKN